MEVRAAATPAPLSNLPPTVFCDISPERWLASPELCVAWRILRHSYEGGDLFSALAVQKCCMPSERCSLYHTPRSRISEASKSVAQMQLALVSNRLHAFHHCTSAGSGPLAPAAAISSLLRASLDVRTAGPSKSRLHQNGGSRGRDPSCSGGYTSVKKYQIWPITTPMISSLGMEPCMKRLKAIKTHGRYGAVNTNSPKKLKRVSGFRRDQMYTSVDESGCPRNGIETNGDNAIRLVMAYRRSQEK